MEMLVLLLADRVVRVTGLLIWQVTWEPGERLQRGSALSITTFLIILSHADKGGVHICLKPAFIHLAYFIVIDCNIFDCLSFAYLGRVCFHIVWLYLKLQNTRKSLKFQSSSSVLEKSCSQT